MVFFYDGEMNKIYVLNYYVRVFNFYHLTVFGKSFMSVLRSNLGEKIHNARLHSEICKFKVEIERSFRSIFDLESKS